MADANSEESKLSLQAKVIRAVTSAYFDLLVDPEKVNLKTARERLDLLGRFVPVASGVKVEPTEVTGLNAEWLRPRQNTPGKVLLYLHGGAYVLGSCHSHRHMVSYLAREGHVDALLPEYRLAPEDRFPAAVDDAVAVFRWLISQGYNADDIIVAGDSAGGGLSVAMMLALRESGGPMPKAAFLLSPWLDLSASGESIETRRDRDPWFKPEDMPVAASFYCDEDEVKNPLVSPVYAEMHDMPKTFVQVGNDEILLSDATRLVEGIRASGGEAEIEVFQEMWHVFQAFLLVMPEARDAIQTLGRKMRATVQG